MTKYLTFNSLLFRTYNWYLSLPKLESTGFRKISMIFTLFRLIFHGLSVSNLVKKTKYCSNQHTYVEILQEIAFHNLSLMNSTFSSTI